ncbi:Enoyl-CoA delta isomerase 1, mitochondrial [Pseudolycoriella hygida]|uniref:Enoyl-CoA delta isomerase 1, mitochondrial n=1 Tax=Pseudolycoriella hygida TaxID=35572 RepID=A0A9Q0NGK8_9DIPT|nr:Enoyl-CoA delta isomerase 1, mitochondrial [Pseudolycoriella hygida]
MIRNSINLLTKKLISSTSCQRTRMRCFSSGATNLVDVNVNDKTGIAVVTLNRPPVNSLNLELLTDLSKTLDELESNRSKGMILTSSSKTVFSAGLDILEMYNPEPERSKAFWTALQDVWLKLYGSPYPTAAAINGHSPAGGCLLAICCEYRVMVNDFTIGLNETRLGISAPSFFISSFRNVLSTREAEKALTLGTMFSSDEALKVGLVDEIATDKADSINKCENFLLEFKKVSSMARAFTKQSLRKKDLEELENNREQDLQLFLFAINQPIVQKGLGAYIQSLKKK